ncbi:uncharacterized protein BDR25DRAFT_381383 [Lindgomyces ingoldianus]|uniref:Uncharacterized protein n=1 Tax=Lindgomyces ingoldianus TaxID=673940 RepID=A0ACB6QCE8_9PLEO|nr:uncharacterized protein BDR25DRAFT_381383 [Lindgomyces ingoldianus]KAF2464273.1 hypothetical protein BDR25DRAFT_381383 [Lindgomyces ingoldianus]
MEIQQGYPDFHALPTYGAVHGIAVMGLVHRAMADFLPNFQGHNHVHGENFLELKKAYPIPNGREEIKLETTAKVVDIVDRRSGVLVFVDIETVEEGTIDVLCVNQWGGFVMKVPTAGANTTPIQRGPRTTLYPTLTRAPDKITAHKTSPEQAALYRAASGYLNPLHIDPETAKAAGFPAPILTGTCPLGMGVRHVVDAFAGGDGRRFKSVKCRLSKPIYGALGQVVRTEMWREEGGRRILYRQVVRNGEREKIVIGMAAVDLWEEGGAVKP